MNVLRSSLFVLILLAAPVKAQESTNLDLQNNPFDWVNNRNGSANQCYSDMIKLLEPLQDSMFDLANLIVFTLCSGQYAREMSDEHGPGQVDIEKGLATIELFKVGQAIAAARLLRLKGGIE